MKKKFVRTKNTGFVEKFGKHIDESWDYLRECKWYIWILFAFFIFSALIGFFIVPLSPDLTEIISRSLRGIIDQTENLNVYELILFIFKNNAWVSLEGVFSPLLILDVLFKGSDLLAFLSSLVFVPLGYLLGIIPFFLSFVNGVVLGFVMSKVYLVSGFSDFWRLLPHGIFELPAVFISLGLGLRLGTFLFSENPVIEFKRRFIGSVKVFLTIVIPLLVIAAIIEGTLIVLMGQ